MSDKTVKITVKWEASSVDAAEEEVIDTKLTPEQWDSLGEEGQAALGDELLAGWLDNAVQPGWFLADGED